MVPNLYFLGDQWIARADLRVSNIFGLRPTGTDFKVGSELTQYSLEDWGDDTVGLLMDNDQSGLCDQNPGTLGWMEEKANLTRMFDLRLEQRFPRNRFQGNCVLSRLGNRI